MSNNVHITQFHGHACKSNLPRKKARHGAQCSGNLKKTPRPAREDVKNKLCPQRNGGGLNCKVVQQRFLVVAY